jgi:electron transport complex protein RnfG
MQTASHDNSAERPASWPMYRALVGVGVVCGLLIVSVFVLTLPVITRNEAEALQQAVLEVLPGAVAKASFTLATDGSFHRAGEGDTGAQVHAGYDAEGRLVGVALESQGMGYQDVIRILYGYAPRQQAIVGMQVLASKETPGLGDKIEKDPAFRANFQALDVRLAAGGESLEHPIEVVKHGTKTSPWQIDGITGATISSKAIAHILRRSSARWVPRLFGRQAELVSGGGADGEH